MHPLHQVSARRRKTFVLADSGQMFAFGWKTFGSLGLTANRGFSEKVLKPAEVIDHHLAQAAAGKAELQIGQVSAGFYHTACLTRDGFFLSFGDNDKGQLSFDAEFPRTPAPSSH